MAILYLCAAVMAVLAWWRTKAQAAAIEELRQRVRSLEQHAAAVRSDPRARSVVTLESDRSGASAVPPTVSTAAPAVSDINAAVSEAKPAVPIPARQPIQPGRSARPTPPALPIGTKPAPLASEAKSEKREQIGVGPQPVGSPRVAARTVNDSLEARIGARWLLYIGVVAIVIGVSYFEKLAIDNHWINETARTIQGGILGALLVYVGIRFVRAGYTFYGQILSGGGVAILYVSTYAAFNLYHLISRPSAFVLMSAITALAAMLADSQRSQGLALMAVGGGFATPFLLPGNTDAEIALFTYDAILIAGTMFLAHRRIWPLLNVVSYGFTVLTVLGWLAQFYEPSKYLATEIFLTLFCGMFLYVLHEMRRASHPRARMARAILVSAPAGYYIASIAILSPHAIALLVYLLALSLVGAVAGKRIGAAARLVCWIAVIAPLAVWIDGHAGRAWLVAGLTAVAGIYTINLLADLERALRNDTLVEPSGILLLHLNALAAYWCAYVLIDAVNAGAGAPFAAGFALWHAAVAGAVARRRRDIAMHFAAVAGALLAIAVTLEYHGAAVIAGWAAEGVAIIWLGLRERREWFRLGGVALFLFAVERLLELQGAPAPLARLVLFNSKTGIGMFVIALTYLATWLHQRQIDRPRRTTEVSAGLVTAKLLILTAVAAEISDYWSQHLHGIFEPVAQFVMAGLIIGSTIVWLGLLRRREWVRAIGGLLTFCAAALLLAIQFVPAPQDYVVILNARMAAGILAVGVFYGLARLQQRLGDHLRARDAEVAILVTSASVFTLSLLTSEIDAYWTARGATDVWSIAREGLQAIVWSAVGSLLVWIGAQRRRGWIRAIGAGVLVVAVSRLVRLQFADAPAGYTVLVNARLIASVIVVAALYGLARLYRSTEEPLDAQLRPRTVLIFAANALSLTLLTSEITAFWHVRDLAAVAVRSASRDSHFARELTLSITWAMYATVLIVAGMRKHYAAIRYFGISLFAVTIVKVFGFDMAELDRIYRVSSIIVLGVLLLATSYLYNRFRGQMTPADYPGEGT
jgi:uncharacterized membrane protein